MWPCDSSQYENYSSPRHCLLWFLAAASLELPLPGTGPCGPTTFLSRQLWLWGMYDSRPQVAWRGHPKREPNGMCVHWELRRLQRPGGKHRSTATAEGKHRAERLAL